MTENFISPTFDPTDNTWFTDDGVEAKSLAELQQKLPDAKIEGYCPGGYGLTVPPRPPHVAKIINYRERKLQFKPEIEEELQRPIQPRERLAVADFMCESEVFNGAKCLEQCSRCKPEPSLLNPRKERAPRSVSKFAAVNWKSQEVIDRLKTLVEAGLTADVIGRQFDCSRNAIIGICYRKGFQLKGRS